MYNNVEEDATRPKDPYEADPVLSECALYTFEPVNPYLNHPDPLKAGLSILDEQGSLTQACLALEAACQRDPNNDVAWMRLGMAQAENEKEGPAIAALQRCVQENPANLEGLMVYFFISLLLRYQVLISNYSFMSILESCC